MERIGTSSATRVRSIAISMSACLPVCLLIRSLAYLEKPFQISQNFLQMLHVTVARSSSDGNATFCVLPVLLMKSYFHIIVRIGKRIVYTGWAKKLHTYCFSTNCATVCANKACFVRFECNT